MDKHQHKTQVSLVLHSFIATITGEKLMLGI
jgi:hypothetical protein